MKTGVSRNMVYKLTGDIDLKGKVDARDLDIAAERLIFDTEFALKQQPNVCPELKTLAADLLRLFITTHQSIRFLFRQNKKSPLFASDAISLCREQVEKLYVLALIIEDPEKWTMQYLRSNWKDMYARHLLDTEEYTLLPRFKQYMTKLGPKELERMRHWPSRESKLGYKVIVSERAKRAVKFSFTNDYPKAAVWPKYFSKRQFDRYFHFPTPKGAMDRISNPEVHTLLRRWYKEYQYYSAYSHIRADKIHLEHMDRYKSSRAAARFEVARNKMVFRAANASYTASASACTIIAPILTADLGVIESLKSFWEWLAEGHLFSRLIWKGYAEPILR